MYLENVEFTLKTTGNKKNTGFVDFRAQAALAGREEDSSDDEEELMAHPWPRQGHHHL